MSEAITEPNPYQAAILYGLNATGKHIYSGSVTEAEKAKRRAANRFARKTRKGSR